MGNRTQALAEQIREATEKAIQMIESVPDSQWKTVVDGPNWTVGVLAHHLGGSWAAAGDFMQLIAEGKDIPDIPGGLDASNAQHAVDFADVSKAEALQVMRAGRDRALEVVGKLSDEQLDKASNPLPLLGGGTATPKQFADLVIIAHAQDHGGAIESTLKG